MSEQQPQQAAGPSTTTPTAAVDAPPPEDHASSPASSSGDKEAHVSSAAAVEAAGSGPAVPTVQAQVVDPALVMTDANFEKRYEEMQKDVERESFDPTPHIIRLEGVIHSLLANTCSLSREHQAYFLHKGLPGVVRNLTRRRFKDNDDQYLRTNEFFTRVLDLIIALIPTDHTELLETLNRIFDDHRAYYYHTLEKEDLLYARLQSEKEGNTSEKPLANFVVTTKSMRSSRFLAYNINYFVNKGGLDALIARVNANPHLSVPHIKLHVMAWHKMRELLIPEVQKRYFPQLEQLFTIMLGLSEEELRNVKKEDVEEIVRSLEAIIRDYAHAETYEKTEKFALAFALKCLRSTNLEKRLHGLAYIDEAISMTQRRKHYQPWDDSYGYSNPAYTAYRTPQVARWMDAKLLLTWIQENQIVERLFQSKQSDMHPELIKRSKNLLRFMASEKFLNQTHLDMMWKATATQHAEPAVYEVLGNISSNLSVEHQGYLLCLIYSIPFAEYSSRTINLIAQLQNNYTTYPSSTEIKLRTMNILWQIVQDDSKVDQAIADAALTQLSKALSSYNLRIHRNMLIQTFIDHIRNRQSVHQSIVLLQKVLQEHYHDDKEMRGMKGTDSSRQKVVNELKSELGLVDLLFRELAQYKQVCVCRRAEILSAAAESGDERMGDVDWNNMVLEGRYPHLKQVSTRLDLIRFVFDYSIARLTKDRADIMWESLVMNCITREEVETTLGWFYRICSNFSKSNSNTITTIMVENFFEHRLCKLDIVSLSVMGFDCFRRYFCCLNAQNKSLRMDGPIDDFLVLEFDGLMGLDQLWNIALNAASEVVFKESMTLLVALYQKVNDTKQFNAVRKSFVDRCMERLQLAHQQISANDNVVVAQNQVDRLIFMLKNFLQESKAREEKRAKEGAGAVVLPSPPKVEAVTTPPKNIPQVKKGKEQELAFLKEMIPGLSTIAAVLALERNYYNLDLALSHLMDDVVKERLMAEASKYEVEAAQAEQAEAERALAVEVEEIAPSKFLFDNQAYFDLLFELLNHDNVDRDRVWEILMELPTNPITEQTLKTLRSPNWDELINARSLYKMLYCLQIIDQLMAYDEKDTEAQLKEKHEWCKLFFHCGGFHHILNLVLHDDFLIRNQGSRAFKSCLRLLLKIIHFFIQGGLADVTLIPPEEQEDDGKEKKGRQTLSLSTNTGRMLIDTVDFPTFLSTMITIVLDTCRGQPHTDDVQIVEYAMQLLVNSIISKPSLLKNFYEYGLEERGKTAKKSAVTITLPEGHNQPEDTTTLMQAELNPIEDVILNVTLSHYEHKIRSAASTNFNQLCAQYPDEFGVSKGLVPPHQFFLELLLSRIPPEGAMNSKCDQFFELLSSLIQRHCLDQLKKGAEVAQVFTKFENLFYSIVDRIKKHPVQEESRDGPPDQLLIGFFDIVNTLLSFNPQLKRRVGSKEGLNLIEELWSHCLFPPPPKFSAGEGLAVPLKWKDGSKCKNSKTRKSCFSLLAALGQDCPENVQDIVQLVLPNHTKELDLLTWDRPTGKNPAGFVGLRNPGCICYMNSLLQQIYMTPTLRYGLLSSNVKVSDAAENVLQHLKNMFCHLQHSEKQYYDPSETFCKAFKDRSGNPIDLHMQQDAEEFLRLLCERLEELLKGTEYEKLLNNFTGVESQILQCPNNPAHFSEREDPISVISIEIKGKANLQEALSYYVQGEQVEWKCEKCGKVVEAALKRLSLKKLPNTLIIHLKRFDFNYETMLRAKLSNLFEFPMDLDMEPYTTEGIAKAEARKRHNEERAEQAEPQEEFGATNSFSDSLDLGRSSDYYQYELVGVLVHSGTAEGGHYYSYIKERTSGSGKWYLFDDKNVTPWDLKDLREECFGGEQVTSAYNSSYYTSKQPKLKNAYMLFYQRKNPQPEEFPIPEQIKAHYRDEPDHPAKIFEFPQSTSQIEDKGKQKDDESAPADQAKEGSQFLTPGALSSRPVPKSPSIYSLSSPTMSSSSLSPSPSIYSLSSSESLKRSPSLCFDLSRFGEKDLDSVFAKVIPEEVLQSVWEENHRVVRDRLLFDREYLEFVRDIMALVTLPPVMDFTEPNENDPAFQVIKSATFFALDTLARAREEKVYVSFMKILMAFYQSHVPACRWLLVGLMDQYKKWYRFHMLDCTDTYVRESFANLLTTLLAAVGKHEEDAMAAERQERLAQLKVTGWPAHDNDTQYTHISTTLNVRFMEYHLALCESTRAAWRRFHQYWLLIKQYALIGYQQRMFLLDRGIIGILIDYYMGDFSPYKKGSSRVKIGDKNVSPELTTFMEALAVCVCSMATDGYKRSNRKPATCQPDDEELAEVSPRCLALLFNRDFYVSLLKQGYNVHTNILMNAHLSWEDEERSYWIMDIIVAHISRVNDGQLDNLIRAHLGMLKVEDSLQQWRVRLLLGTKAGGLLDLIHKNAKRNLVITTAWSQLLLNAIREVPLAATFLYSIKDEWKWLVQYLSEPQPTGNVAGAGVAWGQYEAHNLDKDMKEVATKLRTFWEGEDKEVTMAEWDEAADDVPRRDCFTDI